MTTEILEVSELDTFFEKINAAVDIVSTKLVEVAPEAVDALLTLVWAKGFHGLVEGFFYLLIVLGLVKLLTVLVTRFKAELEKDDCEATLFFLGLASVVTGFTTVIFTVGTLCRITDFYNWLSVLYPEGAVAMKALEAAGIVL